MSRKLIIDGNAVYELDENCMLKKRLDQPEKAEDKKKDTGDRGNHLRNERR